MPSSKRKHGTAYKQTTLFDAVGGCSKPSEKSNSIPVTRGAKKISSPRGKQVFEDSESEGLAAIRFAAEATPSSPMRNDHESDEDGASNKPLPRKRLSRHNVLDSDSEQPSAKMSRRRPLIQSSDEEVQEDRPRKKGRLQRRNQSDCISSSDEDIAKLAQEVDENRMSLDH